MSDVKVSMTEAIQTLDEQAKRAKRQEAAARRQARDIRRVIESLHRVCLEYGIELILEPPHSREAQ